MAHHFPQQPEKASGAPIQPDISIRNSSIGHYPKVGNTQRTPECKVNRITLNKAKQQDKIFNESLLNQQKVDNKNISSKSTKASTSIAGKEVTTAATRAITTSSLPTALFTTEGTVTSTSTLPVKEAGNNNVKTNSDLNEQKKSKDDVTGSTGEAPTSTTSDNSWKKVAQNIEDAATTKNSGDIATTKSEETHQAGDKSKDSSTVTTTQAETNQASSSQAASSQSPTNQSATTTAVSSNVNQTTSQEKKKEGFFSSFFGGSSDEDDK